MSRNGAAMSTSAHSEWVTGCRVPLCRCVGHAREDYSYACIPLLISPDAYAHRPPCLTDPLLLRQRCPLLRVVV